MTKKTNWGRYGECPTCYVSAKQPCLDTRSAHSHSLRTRVTPHSGRRSRVAARQKGNQFHCRYCKTYKDASQFTKSAKRSDGLSVRCLDCQRDQHLRTAYGITTAQYDKLLEAQGGKCALCDVEVADASGRRLAVDHCHETGKVRGLLCTRCNQSLERVEIPGWAKKAVTYINYHRGESR